MKQAKLVRISLITRVVVEKNAPEHEILGVAEEQFIEKLKIEGIQDHFTSIKNDKECPFGTFTSDNINLNT